VTAPFIGTLQADLRFRAAPLELRGVYRMLTDYQDAAGDVAAKGLSGLEAAAVALGCDPADASPLLERLAGLGLLQVDPSRVRLLVGSPRGSRGGMSDAERKRLQRSRSVTARVTGNVTTEVTDSVTGQVSETAGETAIGHGSVTAAVTDESRPEVTDSVTGQTAPPTVTPNENTGVSGVAASTDAGPSASSRNGPSPQALSPHSPLSPTPTPGNENRARGEGPVSVDAETAARLQRLADLEAAEALRLAAEAAKAARAAKRAERKQTADRPDTIPLAGTLAFAVYQAIVTDAALEPITRQCPGDFATRITNPLAHPGVDVLATVLAGAEYVARNPGKYADGRRFLTNQLRERPVRNDPTKSGVIAVPRRPDAAPAHDPWAAGLALLDAQPPKETRRA
jgi:hypothetical protein